MVIDLELTAANHYLRTLSPISHAMVELSLQFFEESAKDKVRKRFNLSSIPPKDRLRQELINIAWLHNMFNIFNKKANTKLSPAPSKIYLKRRDEEAILALMAQHWLQGNDEGKEKYKKTLEAIKEDFSLKSSHHKHEDLQKLTAAIDAFEKTLFGQKWAN